MTSISASLDALAGSAALSTAMSSSVGKTMAACSSAACLATAAAATAASFSAMILRASSAALLFARALLVAPMHLQHQDDHACRNSP